MLRAFGVSGPMSLGLLVCPSLLLGCSFAGEPPPGSANELRPNEEGYRCGKSLWYPAADTVSTIASATWVIRANDELETHSQDSEGDIWRASRIAGWVGIGLFGASAIYGYVVEGRCGQLRRNRELAVSAPSAPSRPDFPGNVFGFGFRMQRADLVRQCLSKDGQWSMDGAVGRCRPRTESSANPEVRIAFQLGVPSEVRTIFTGSAQTKNRDYQSLASSLRQSYGPPQVEGALSPSCQASLAQCLQSGERPKGPVWHWAAGTVELAPIWADERAVLEIRYTPEDAAAQ